MSKSKTVGIAVGMAALALFGLTTGCRTSSGRNFFSWGCLTEADSSGAPAYAELATVPTGQIVRVWDQSPLESVTVEVLGGDFSEVAPGTHEVGPDGLIVAGDVAVEIHSCAGETEDEIVCAPISATAIDVDVLEDGARRLTYRGTSTEGVTVEGSFVVGR